MLHLPPLPTLSVGQMGSNVQHLNTISVVELEFHYKMALVTAWAIYRKPISVLLSPNETVLECGTYKGKQRAYLFDIVHQKENTYIALISHLSILTPLVQSSTVCRIWARLLRKVVSGHRSDLTTCLRDGLGYSWSPIFCPSVYSLGKMRRRHQD